MQGIGQKIVHYKRRWIRSRETPRVVGVVFDDSNGTDKDEEIVHGRFTSLRVGLTNDAVKIVNISVEPGEVRSDFEARFGEEVPVESRPDNSTDAHVINESALRCGDSLIDYLINTSEDGLRLNLQWG